MDRNKIKTVNTPNRLVVFTSLPEVGGHTTISLGLINLLRQDYDEIWVIAREMRGHGTSRSAVSQLANAGATVLTLEGRSAIVDLARVLFARDFRNRRTDSFIAIGMRNLSPILALVLKPSVSVYYHITHELTGSIVRMLIRYMRFIQKLVFISPATEALFHGLTDASSIATQSITQSIGGAEYLANVTRVDQNMVLRLGFMGRLSDAKGCGVLKEFVINCPFKCTLRIAGSGEYSAQFKELAEANRTNVKLLYDGAFSPETRQCYLTQFFSSIDYLIVPSQDDREGIPTVILESLVAGVPVIATRTGGMVAFESGFFTKTNCIRLIDKSQVLVELTKMAEVGPMIDDSLRNQCTNYFALHFSDGAIAEQWQRVLQN